MAASHSGQRLLALLAVEVVDEVGGDPAGGLAGLRARRAARTAARGVRSGRSTTLDASCRPRAVTTMILPPSPVTMGMTTAPPSGRATSRARASAASALPSPAAARS